MHDVEFVSAGEVLQAVKELRRLRDQGLILLCWYKRLPCRDARLSGRDDIERDGANPLDFYSLLWQLLPPKHPARTIELSANGSQQLRELSVC